MANKESDRTVDSSLPLYTISVVAEKFSIHPQTLRLYEREGLLKPQRSQGNTRLYSDADIKHLEFLLNLTRDLGVNLAGIEIIIRLKNDLDQIQHRFAEVLAFIREYLEHHDPELAKRLDEALDHTSHSDFLRTVDTNGIEPEQH